MNVEDGTVTRPVDGRLVGGVCAALADRWRVNRSLLRFGVALLALASGLGVAVYVALWLSTPSQGHTDAPIYTLLRGDFAAVGVGVGGLGRAAVDAWARTEHTEWPRPITRRWLGIGLVVGGAWLVFAALGLLSWLRPGVAVGLAAMTLGVALIRSLSAAASEEV